MLKSFEISNFKSFKNTTSFLLKKENINFLEENTYNDLLKGLLFVGPNASGKTNSISALQTLLEIVFCNKDISIYINLFSNSPMWLKYTFLIKDSELIYYTCYEKNVIKETLTLDGEIIYSSNPKIDGHLKDFIENSDNSIINKWYSYLKNSVIIDLYNRKVGDNYSFINPETLYTNEIIEEINLFLQSHDFDFTLNIQKNPCKLEEIFFIKNDTSIKMPFYMESIGNKTLVYLLPIIIKAVKNHGMLILDEFGSGMHNELEELLIRYFMKNSKNSQLFIVSHSTNLLKNSLLRPDQIYSIDFNENGSISEKFSEQKPRNTQNLENMYLGGVFGGLPNYSIK